MASVMGAISEALNEFDSLVFRKNPTNADSCFPESRDVEMKALKRGVWYTTVVSREDAKDEDVVHWLTHMVIELNSFAKKEGDPKNA